MNFRARSVLLTAVVGGLLVYLAGDLFVWRGPLGRRLDGVMPGGRRVVARVFDRAITRSQVERAVRERLWREGKSSAELSAQNLIDARQAALDALIDDVLLGVKAAAAVPRLTPSEADIDERLRRFRAGFDSPDAMAGALRSQGIPGEPSLRERLTDRIQQEQYIESKLGPLVRITEAEARQWFEANRQQLARPECVEVRHIFLPTLERAPQEARAKLAAALADLTSGKQDFAALARTLSEDPATKDHGGALGWMTRERLPADFASQVFTLAVGQPAMVRTRIGWHLVEVTGHLPSGSRAFEQAKAEILAAFEAVKRRQVITEFRKSLRELEAAHITVYPDRLAE